jgi:hypothetical protein
MSGLSPHAKRIDELQQQSKTLADAYRAAAIITYNGLFSLLATITLTWTIMARWTFGWSPTQTLLATGCALALAAAINDWTSTHMNSMAMYARSERLSTVSTMLENQTDTDALNKDAQRALEQRLNAFADPWWIRAYIATTKHAKR